MAKPNEPKMPDLPKVTQREYTSKISSKSKLKKGKTVKHSVTSLSISTLTTMAVPHIQKTSLCEISGNVNEQQSTDDQTVHIPAVPMSWSLPPTGHHAIIVTPPVGLAIDTTNIMTPSSNIAGAPITTDMAAATACTAPIIQPTSQAGSPQPQSQLGSALLQGHPVSTHDPSTQLHSYIYSRYKNKFSCYFRTLSCDKTDELTSPTRECIGQPWFIMF